MKEWMMNRTQVTTAARLPSQRGLRWMMLSVLVAVSATVAMSAWAQPMRHGMGGPGGGGMMFGGSPEHVARGVDRMLDGLGATDAQRTQIKQIAQAVAADMKTQHEATRALREKSQQIFAAPTVDAAAAESVRQQLVVKHDESSRRMLQAMLDVSRVLTPEQRAKLAERMKQRSEHMRERGARMEPPPAPK
jgi:Spy/CpxP family protein refolding chaperone